MYQIIPLYDDMKIRTLLVTFQKNTQVIGLKYIHSYLCKNQIDSYILFIPKYNKKDILCIEKFLNGFKPRIIGISLMSSEFDNAKKFSTIIKNKFPEIIIVWGGIHPTVDTKECLNYADYVFIGESEESYLEFVNKISKNRPVDDILNLAYRLSDKIHINKLRPLNENLDDLPFPEHFPKKSYILHNGNIIKLNKPLFKKYARYSGKYYSITTSRGCPSSCSYCYNSVLLSLYGENLVRKRSVENVMEELKQAISLFPKIIYVNIEDNNFFSHDIEWMKKFSRLCNEEIKKKFICRTNPTDINEEKVSTLKEAGLSCIFIGLQSGSTGINRKIYKRLVPIEKFIEATRVVKKYNITVFYDVILDNPYETEKDVLKTIEIILKIPRPFMLQLFSLCFYQGTEIYYQVLKDNLTFENPLKKNYAKFRPTFLNKIIRLCPLFPRRFINFLVKYKFSKLSKFLVNLIYFPSTLILEPILLFRLVFISFDYHILNTLKTIFFFSKTGFSRIILRE